jgi:hypothetical protein
MLDKCIYCWDWNSAAFGYGVCPVCQSIYTSWEFESLEMRIDQLEKVNATLKEQLENLQKNIKDLK